jgi:hypothetical protein
MFAHRELSRLEAHKAVLRRRIARRRSECRGAAERFLQPVAWLDRAIALWRRCAPFAPLAAVPLAFLFKRATAPGRSVVGALLRWAPVVFGAVRSLAGTAHGRNG